MGSESNQLWKEEFTNRLWQREFDFLGIQTNSGMNSKPINLATLLGDAIAASAVISPSSLPLLPLNFGEVPVVVVGWLYRREILEKLLEEARDAAGCGILLVEYAHGAAGPNPITRCSSTYPLPGICMLVVLLITALVVSVTFNMSNSNHRSNTFEAGDTSKSTKSTALLCPSPSIAANPAQNQNFLSRSEKETGDPNLDLGIGKPKMESMRSSNFSSFCL